jgi:hypothetical protein
MSGSAAMICSGRFCEPRLVTKPSPLTLGLNSVQPRSAQMTVDQRFAGSEAPVPSV